MKPTNTAAHGPRTMDVEPATFRDILPKLRDLIPHSLIDGQAWDRLLDRAGDLPAWLPGTYFGFEFRLGDSTPAADFFVRMLLSGPFTQEYVRRGEAAQSSSAEASLARFLVEANQANSPLTDLFDTVGLECDIAEVPVDRRPAPGVFLKLRPGAKQTGRAPSMVADAIADVVGWRSDEGERHALERAFEVLPAGGEVGYVGALPGRKTRAVRVIVRGIWEPDVPAFLQRLAWPGPVDRVVEVLADLGDVSPHFRVAFDVTARGVAPHLGLEMGALEPQDQQVAPHEWLYTERRHWLPLVTRVEERGWCLPAKARGLLDYLELQTSWDKTGMFQSYKGINHIKISIDAASVSAKGYVGMFFRQFHSRAVVQAKVADSPANPQEEEH